MKNSKRVAPCVCFAAIAVGSVVAADDPKAPPAETILAAPVSGHPISFAVDGHQYIAVSTGGNTHPEKTALSLHPKIKVTQGYNSLFVFRLRAAPALG